MTPLGAFVDVDNVDTNSNFNLRNGEIGTRTKIINLSF